MNSNTFILKAEDKVTKAQLAKDFPELFKKKKIGKPLKDLICYDVLQIDEDLAIYVQDYIDKLNKQNKLKYANYEPSLRSIRSHKLCKFMYFYGTSKEYQCNNLPEHCGLCDEHQRKKVVIEPIIIEEVGM